MSGWEVALVAVAALASGAVNALAGGGSLVLFPALVATGMGPLAANVSTAVATWPGYIGSVAGFRRELAHQRPRVPRLALATLVGSALGCVLLLNTSTDAFEAIVPFLVLGAAGLLGAQPLIARRVGQPLDATTRTRAIQTLAVAAAAAYGGYFGAALGVLFLGVLALTIAEPLRELNGLKSIMSLVDATVSVVIFGLFGPVAWGAVAVAAPATLLGGYVGAHWARRVDERALRTGIVAFSVLVAVYLAVR